MLILVLVVIAVVGVAVGLLLLRGNEDTWICQNGAWVRHGNPFEGPPNTPCGKGITMMLISRAFGEGEELAKRYTCQGLNRTPPFIFSGVPAEAKSLAMTLEDPDAPGGTFQHWLMWNIDPKTPKMEENEQPAGAILGTNSTGKVGYMAPCPPSGTHHYIFTLYALDTMLTLDSSGDRKAFDASISGHIISQATLTGVYAKH